MLHLITGKGLGDAGREEEVAGTPEHRSFWRISLKTVVGYLGHYPHRRCRERESGEDAHPFKSVTNSLKSESSPRGIRHVCNGRVVA